MTAVFREPDSADASVVIEPYWQDVVERFEKAGFDVGRVKLVVDETVHDTCRHMAMCLIDGSVIHVAPELAASPVPTIQGVLAHEAGHSVDLSSPGTFFCRSPNAKLEGAILLFRQDDRGLWQFDGEAPSKRAENKRINRWLKRGHDEIEFVADLIASYVLGQHIGYVGPCLVQAVGQGPIRPVGLR